jgi:hypothetical protein
MRVNYCEYIGAENLNLGIDSNFEMDFKENNTIDNWYKKSGAKKYIIYKSLELINAVNPSNMIEIGGGFTSFSMHLANKYSYVNYDLLDHYAGTQEPPNWLRNYDWRKVVDLNADLILVLDVFPNADQGLEEFLNKVNEGTKVIMTITLRENQKQYLTKRINEDEYLTLVSWNMRTLSTVISETIINLLKSKKGDSISGFPDGRDVWLLYFEK